MLLIGIVLIQVVSNLSISRQNDIAMLTNLEEGNKSSKNNKSFLEYNRDPNSEQF
jgi:hypothetical protein